MVTMRKIFSANFILLIILFFCSCSSQVLDLSFVGAALYDKYLLGVKQFPSDAVQFWFSVWLVVILGAAYAVRRFCFPQKNALPFQWRLSIPLTGILLICADFLYFHALSCPDTPVSILSLVRRSNCIVAFTIGSIWFHEKNKGKKSIALAAVLIGVAILALAKSR